AGRYLELAEDLGYRHPMMAKLRAMIQAQPQVWKSPDSGEARLRELLLRLAEHAAGPMAWSLSAPGSTAPPGEDGGGGGPATFEVYVRQAGTIATGPDVSQVELLSILDDSRAIGGDTGEFLADLLRRVAEARGDAEFLDRATGRHLRVLRDMAFGLFGAR